MRRNNVGRDTSLGPASGLVPYPVARGCEPFAGDAEFGTGTGEVAWGSEARARRRSELEGVNPGPGAGVDDLEGVADDVWVRSGSNDGGRGGGTGMDEAMGAEISVDRPHTEGGGETARPGYRDEGAGEVDMVRGRGIRDGEGVWVASLWVSRSPALPSRADEGPMSPTRLDGPDSPRRYAGPVECKSDVEMRQPRLDAAMYDRLRRADLAGKDETTKA